MKKISRLSRALKIHGAICFVVAAAATAAMADQVIIESYDTNGNHNLDPSYTQIPNLITVWSGSGSGSHSSAPGIVATRSTFCVTNNVSGGVPPEIVLVPELAVPGGVYNVDVTHISGNACTNLVVSITGTNCTLSTNQTVGFDQNHGINVWYTVCQITNNPGVTNPTVAFTYLSGNLNNTSNGRWYTDGYRFTYAGDPCINVPQIATVNGPLAAGQTFVNVPGVSTLATNVSVYADSGSGGVLIGSVPVTNATSAVVPCTALVQGNFITANQTISNVLACSYGPGIGQIVGAGPNSSLRFCVSLARDGSLTGPAGAAANSASTDFYWLGASAKFNPGSTGGGPVDGMQLLPSTCWQTVSFDPQVDATFAYGGGSGTPDTNPFAAMNSLCIAIDDLTDSGPYNIYIDNLQNGSTVIDDFETSSNGAFNAGFLLPSASGVVSGFTTKTYMLAQPPGTVLPNIASVNTNHADTGNKACEVSWQFKDVSHADWIKLDLASEVQVDMTKPISFRVLILPTGVTNGDSRISTIPTQTNTVGSTATFTVTAAGSGPFTYQWYDNTATAIGGATSSSYSRPSITTNDAGTYSVVVTDAHACTSSTSAELVVNNTITPVPISISYVGGKVVLNWSGSHTLQSTTAVGASSGFMDVPGPVLTGPYTNTPSTSATYYRLRN